uniref:Uncharacterized protein n=1 Tax=Rhizophora mucronata TaxID=61149 RepID=A0A2P2JT10_RHIMU
MGPFSFWFSINVVQASTLM